MLPSRVTISQPPNPTLEDIFSTSLGTLFTDDTQNCHGTPGQAVIYHSSHYGDINLGIPQHPDVEEGRKLFAHYLWNAGVVAADAIETASQDRTATQSEEFQPGKVNWDQRYWDVRDQDVLELGAGTALPSIISGLSSATSITITDHPSSPALTNDTIAKNVLNNLQINLHPPTPTSGPSSSLPPDTVFHPKTSTHIEIHGLTWGDTHFTSTTKYGKPSSPQPARNSFDKIIIADCLWMPSQHENLVKTIDDYLKVSHDAGDGPRSPEGQEVKAAKTPCALIIAGFHTGRSTVAGFFEIATGSKTGVLDSSPRMQSVEQEAQDQGKDDVTYAVKGILLAAEIFEIDVDCNVRPWVPERKDENEERTKRWCVVAVLVRRR